jgi:hypothetical protein
MRCTNCGQDRPSSGNCPNCGAPTPSGASFSSLRGWRDQAGSPNGSRVSRPNPDDQRPASRTQGSGRSGTNWDAQNGSSPRRGGDPNQSMPRRGGDPNGSYGRRDASYPRPSQTPSRPNNQSFPRRDDYDDYGQADDRALMVPPSMSAMLPATDDRALPALPSEEEERALGIRRPAFIPATDERKGAKPGRWRVISGVLSIMVLCVSMCGVTGVLAKNNVIPWLSKLLGFSPPSNASSVPAFVLPPQYLNNSQLVTPTPGAKTPIQNIGTYRFTKTSPGTDTVTPQDPSAVFAVNEPTYIVMDLGTTVKAGDTISVEWFFGQSADPTQQADITPATEQFNPQCCSDAVPSTGRGLQVVFKIVPPTTGFGHGIISYNKSPAYTVLFADVPPNELNTPTPSPTAKK